jgi:hypothetical protein
MAAKIFSVGISTSRQKIWHFKDDYNGKKQRFVINMQSGIYYCLNNLAEFFFSICPDFSFSKNT